MLTYFLGRGVKMLTVAEKGRRGSKMAKKVLMYSMDGPLVAKLERPHKSWTFYLVAPRVCPYKM